MVNFLTLNGSIRKNLGSGNTNRLRKDGNIPAVIYGNNGEDNNADNRCSFFWTCRY